MRVIEGFVFDTFTMGLTMPDQPDEQVTIIDIAGIARTVSYPFTSSPDATNGPERE